MSNLRPHKKVNTLQGCTDTSCRLSFLLQLYGRCNSYRHHPPVSLNRKWCTFWKWSAHIPARYLRPIEHWIRWWRIICCWCNLAQEELSFFYRRTPVTRRKTLWLVGDGRRQWNCQRMCVVVPANPRVSANTMHTQTQTLNVHNGGGRGGSTRRTQNKIVLFFNFKQQNNYIK